MRLNLQKNAYRKSSNHSIQVQVKVQLDYFYPFFISGVGDLSFYGESVRLRQYSYTALYQC